MKRIVIIPLFLVLFVSVLNGQSDTLEFGVDVGTGVSWLRVDEDGYETSPGIDLNMTMYFNYFFGKEWGMHWGLGISSYASTIKASDYSQTISEGADPIGDYHLYLLTHGYQENVVITSLSIPVGVVYRHELSDGVAFVGSMGFRLEMPVSLSYEMSSGSLSTRMYYPSIMKDESESLFNVPEMGCYEQRSQWPENEEALTRRYNMIMYFDAGFVYKISETMMLGTSLYFGTSLYSLTAKESDALLTLNSDNSYTYNSSTSFARTTMLHCGITVGLTFGNEE